MKKMNLYLQGLINVVLAGVYISLVALFISHAESIFGKQDGGFLGTIVFLMLLVLSASVMGVLILGKPIMMYIDGQKKEGVKLLGITIGWIFVFILLATLIKIAM